MILRQLGENPSGSLVVTQYSWKGHKKIILKGFTLEDNISRGIIGKVLFNRSMAYFPSCNIGH